MALQIKQVSNPLTLIAIFASLAEIAATAVLPLLDGAVQGDLRVVRDAISSAPG